MGGFDLSVIPGIETWDELERRLHRTAVQYLLDRGDEPKAMAVLSCGMRTDYLDGWDHGCEVCVILSAEPRLASTIREQMMVDVKDAFDACAPYALHVKTVIVESHLLHADEHWRETLTDQLRGKGINNQGIERGQLRAPHVVEGLRYRSPPEVAIAQALEATDAAYWPNCLGRLGLDKPSRKTREADFLIHRHGRWGILEVDGANYHGGRAAEDHARDRVFLQHGHMLIQRFPARDCLTNPALVVAEFFKLLANTRP